ncbi:MAG: hypothetical protein HY816_20725 [Candidatus Wallbacteria bacterium]|nr:hypothetical protein [Candidatus Wallbacteria bacterium]
MRRLRALLSLLVLGGLWPWPLASKAAGRPPLSVPPATADLTPAGYRELLRLKDAKLFKVIEIYSRLTGVNVLVDDTVKDRGVTLSVTDLPIERVLELVLLTNSLCKKQVSANVAIVYPPSREETYREKTRARVFELEHKTPQELAGLVRPAFPKTTMLPDEKTRSLVAFADEKTLDELRLLVARLDRPQLPVEREVFVLEHLDPAAAVPYVQGICPTVKTFVDAGIRTLTVYAPPEALEQMRAVLTRLDRRPARWPWRSSCWTSIAPSSGNWASRSLRGSSPRVRSPGTQPRPCPWPSRS